MTLPTPFYEREGITIYVGDNVDVLPHIEPVHAVVTDPPSGISFMGKEWDSNKGGRDQWIAWLAETLRGVSDAMLPGAHALIWALPRTSGWTSTAIEDAGLEVRDCITHLFGSGFPKSHDVSKAIDKMAGAEREVVKGGGRSNIGTGAKSNGRSNFSQVLTDPTNERTVKNDLTLPATPEAEQWQGWGTALKPAAEFWYCAQKRSNPASSSAIIDTATFAVEALLWSIAPAKFVELLSASSPLGQGEASGSVRWLADVLHGLQSDEASALMDTFNSQAEARTYSNIARSWSVILADHFASPSMSTTETATDLTIGLQTLNSLILAIIPEPIIQAALANGGLWRPARDAENDSSGTAQRWKHIPTPTVHGSAWNAIVPACERALASIVEARSKPRQAVDGDSAEPSATTPIEQSTGLPTQSPTVDTEFWYLARKPFKGTVAANVLAHGTGALNIDASRIGTDEIETLHTSRPAGDAVVGRGAVATGERSQHTGRWPANVLLDEEAAAMLDAQSGVSTSKRVPRPASSTGRRGGIMGDTVTRPDVGQPMGHNDTGGASRFFYVAKASRAERNRGLDGMPERASLRDGGRFHSGGRTMVDGEWRETGSTPQPKANSHPTVKPLALMRYLIQMVTPPGGIVLDPFMGSGSTLVAAAELGFNAIGIELSEEYAEIAARRVDHVLNERAKRLPGLEVVS